MSAKETCVRRYIYHTTTAWGSERKNRFVKRLFDNFLPELEKGCRILEVGAGRGELAREAMNRGFDYEGIEPSAELRTALERKGVKVVDATVPPIPAPDGSFDLILSVDVMEHLQDYKEVMDFCQEAYRALMPRGYFCVVAPNFDMLGWVFYAYEYQHSFVTNKVRLEGVLKDSGFQCCRSRTFLTALGLTRWSVVDRVAAHILVPIVTNRIFCGVLRAMGQDLLLFRIHKNLCDHVGVVGKKPVCGLSHTSKSCATKDQR